MASNWLHGIDVSHWQQPALVPWDTIAASSKFVIVKASDGIGRDQACAEHVRCARDVGLTVGLYHFFRDTLPVQSQLEVFGSVADACELAPGDLLPCLDVEDYPGHAIGPHTSEPAEEWCESATNTWGSAVVYTSQRDWGRMGGPAWVLAYPLWIAHYPGKERPAPATPDHRPFRIWQYNGTAAYGPGQWKVHRPAQRNAIDMNWAIDPLPLIAEPGQVAVEPEPYRPEPAFLTAVDWDELRAARDAAIKGE
jgi:lysozyme